MTVAVLVMVGMTMMAGTAPMVGTAAMTMVMAPMTTVMIAMTMVMIALLSPKEAQKVGDEGMGSSLPTETKLDYIYNCKLYCGKEKQESGPLVVKDITVL